jgi:5'-nucleotidase (lipoprotein e(P4) family)
MGDERMMMSRLILVVLVAGGCGRGVVAGPGAPAPGAVPAGAIHWTRTAAEHRAVFLQTYRWAEQRVRELAAGKAGGTWAVILDADETVIDNSTYQSERAAAGLGYSEESWTEWIERRAATALPGALPFMQVVRGLGGRVVIVTNRTEAQCEDTRANFTTLGLVVDLMLCRPPESSDKNPRFAAVQNGTAVAGVPALEVLMWVGDNIQDFPRLTQQITQQGESQFASFGGRFIILPNPMYGSWERNPAR